MVLPAFSEQSLVFPKRHGEALMIHLVPRNQPAPVLSQTNPKWMDVTVSRLESLARLSEDWDSYGASRVESSRIQQAYNLLQSTMDEDTPAPILVPTPEGSIQMEWHTLGIELEVSLLSDTDLDVCFEDLSGTERPFDAVLSYDVTPLRGLMQLLASRARDAKHA